MRSRLRSPLDLGPSLRWHQGRITTALRRPGFGAIGDGTVIVRPQTLRGTDRIFLGARCAIYDGAWLQCEDVDGARIEVGDDCYLGPGAHRPSIDPVRFGAGCVLADGAFVTSADHERDNRHDVHGTGPVSIGDHVFLGQRAVVLGGVTIGDGATIRAHAKVSHDAPVGATAVGVPARVLPARPDRGHAG